MLQHSKTLVRRLNWKPCVGKRGYDAINKKKISALWKMIDSSSSVDGDAMIAFNDADMREIIPKLGLRKKKKYGIEMSLSTDREFLTCLCFADDILLVSSGKQDVSTMLAISSEYGRDELIWPSCGCGKDMCPIFSFMP